MFLQGKSRGKLLNHHKEFPTGLLLCGGDEREDNIHVRSTGLLPILQVIDHSFIHDFRGKIFVKADQ